MRIYQYLTMALIVALLNACASVDSKYPIAHVPPVNSVFCDTYFIYQMCVEDVDDNGDVDILFFQDTGEVFMYQAGQEENISGDKPLHECAQIMDDSMQAASSELLYVTDDMGFFEKTRIKKNLMVNYARYRGRINQCNIKYELTHSIPEDDFGDEEF